MSRKPLAVAMAIAACATVFTAPAQAAAYPEMFQVDLEGGRYLDARPDTVHHNGGTVWIWDENGSFNQHWYWEDDNTMRPRNNRGMCLDADPGQNWDGGRVYLWQCNGGPQQKWYRDRTWGMRNGYSGRCLDANPNTNHNGGTVYQWSCNGGSAQIWYKYPAE